METEVQPQLHTLSTVSARTSLSRSALYREIARKRLNAVKVGKALRITEAELRRYIASLESRPVA
jgi:excisionase family DNA binding protein